MKILDRYIAATVIGATLTALAVLLALYTFLTFIEELDGSVLMALAHTVLTIPGWTNDLFPVAALLGGLLGLGRLASSSELTVMRAAGYSLGRITRAVFAGGLVLMLVVVLLGELVAPRTDGGESGEALRLPSGDVWLRADEHVVHARRVPAVDRLDDVTVYTEADDGQLASALHADSAHHDPDTGWRLKGVARTTFGDARLATRTADDMAWPGGPDPGVLELVAADPERLGIVELRAYIDYLRANDLNSDAAELTFWRKLAAPLTTAGMLMLALPFVMGSLRTVSVGTRTFIGTLVGIGFFLFNHGFGNLSVVYGLAPFWGAFVPTIAVFVVAGIMASRIRG